MDKEPFLELYKKLRLISDDSLPLPIHQVCSHRERCWEGSNDRFPPDDEESSHISRPWVGPRYEELRLATIGVNLNGYGGLDALVDLTEEAKEKISDGWRKVRFGAEYKDYSGSFLWHRLGSYSTAFAEFFDLIKATWGDDGYPEVEDVSSAFDFIAFLEHIKCSPIGENSKPTAAMWENCGAHILRQELLLLKPAHILVLGTSDNSSNLHDMVFDSGWQDCVQIGEVLRAKGKIGGSPVTIWVVRHPTSYGGASNSIVQDLRKALQEKEA